LNANIITEGKGAGDSCSGKWDKLYYRGEIFSATHNLNVYYEYNLDSQYDPIISAAKSLLQQLESSNVATPCSSSEDSSSTGDTKDTSIPTTQSELEPVSPTDDDTKDSRCPEKYVYVEKIGMCRFDAPIDPRCPEGYVYLEEHSVCAALIKVPAKNLTPLSELNDFDEILDEGKRLAEQDQNYDKAVLYFKKAIQVEPENARAYYNIAETLFNYLDKKDSVEYYKKLLEIIPTHTTAKNRLNSMNVPLTDEAEKDIQDFAYEIEEMDRRASEIVEEMQIMLELFEGYESSEEYYDEEYEIEKRELDELDKRLDKLFKKLREQAADMKLEEYLRAEEAWEEFQKQEEELKRKQEGTYEYYKLKEFLVEYVDRFSYGVDWEKEIERIPGWIKNNAKWWSEGQIGDSDFVGGIQHMIKEDIISIPNLPEQASTTAEEHVPDWIRNNAGWWADGLISEDDFVGGIKWLVENGIIKV